MGQTQGTSPPCRRGMGGAGGGVETRGFPHCDPSPLPQGEGEFSSPAPPYPDAYGPEPGHLPGAHHPRPPPGTTALSADRMAAATRAFIDTHHRSAEPRRSCNFPAVVFGQISSSLVSILHSIYNLTAIKCPGLRIFLPPPNISAPPAIYRPIPVRLLDRPRNRTGSPAVSQSVRDGGRRHPARPGQRYAPAVPVGAARLRLRPADRWPRCGRRPGQRSGKADAWVAHTLETRRANEDLLGALQDAEAAVRAYLLIARSHPDHALRHCREPSSPPPKRACMR